MSIAAGDDGGITRVGCATIGGAGDITGVIKGGDGVPRGPDGPDGAGGTGGTGGTHGTGSTTGGRYLMLTSGPHGSGPVASTTSGVTAMIGTRSTSQVTPRVLLDWPDNVTTFTQSRGCSVLC